MLRRKMKKGERGEAEFKARKVGEVVKERSWLKL